MVRNPENRLSHNMAHIKMIYKNVPLLLVMGKLEEQIIEEHSDQSFFFRTAFMEAWIYGRRSYFEFWCVFMYFQYSHLKICIESFKENNT